MPSAPIANQESSLSGSIEEGRLRDLLWPSAGVMDAAPKLTIRAPQPFKKSRRDGIMSFRLSIFPNGPQHTNMCKAAAENSPESFADLLIAGLWVSIENTLRRQDDAAEAIPALRCSFFNESQLNRMRLLRSAQPFQRSDLRLSN